MSPAVTNAAVLAGVCLVWALCRRIKVWLLGRLGKNRPR